MTRPSPWKRSSAPQRRRQRKDFEAIRDAVAASPEMQAYREANRRRAAAQQARQKLYRATTGETVPRLTDTQFQALNAARRAEAVALGLSPIGSKQEF